MTARTNVPSKSWFDPLVGATLHTGVNAVEAGSRMLPGRPMAADIETPGLHTYTINCITAAWMDPDGTVHAILLDPRETGHRTLWLDMLLRCGSVVFHNSSYDLPILWENGLFDEAALRKVNDTIIHARMAYPSITIPKKLEKLAQKHLGLTEFTGGMESAFKAAGYKTQQAGFENMSIASPIYRLGAMIDTVVTLKLEPILVRQVMDWLTDHPFHTGAATCASEAREILERQHRANRIMLRRSCVGLAVDPTYLQTYAESVDVEKNQSIAFLAQHYDDKGLPLRGGASKGLKIVQWLERNGHLPAEWPRTKTGQLSAAKDDMDTLDHPLAKAQRFLAQVEKIEQYISKVQNQYELTGRCHPQVAILGASQSGRLCIPTTHGILTARGVLKYDEVRMWDMTLDAEGNWVPITGIYNYEDAPTVIRTGRNIELEATAEHRWVSSSEYGNLYVGPLEEGVRRTIHLAPLVNDFDIRGARVLDVTTEGETFAAIIGMLVTDGRCIKDPKDGGLRAFIYQTEKKLYREFLDAIPDEALMYDRIPKGSATCHELRVRARWLSPRLKKAGLKPDPHLSDDQNLSTWVMSLTPRECAAFLRAAQMGDGTASSQSCTQRITTSRAATAQAFQIAAYRLGLRTRLAHVKGTGEGFTGRYLNGRPLVSNKPVTDVIFLPPVVGTDNLEVSKGRSDVWCVTTSTGTFTAWNDGPYLTGNSVSGPEYHQFSELARPIITDDGQGLTSIDWSQIEPVTMALMAGDTEFLAPFENGADLYEPIGRATGQPRKVNKVVLLAAMYGQGVGSLARAIGHTQESAAQIRRQMFCAMPASARWMNKVTTVAETHGRVVTVGGRILPVMSGYAYRSVNHVVQGSAADVLIDAMLRMEDAGISDHIQLSMHDEIVVDTEVAQEAQRIMGTPPDFLVRAAGRSIVLRTDSNDMGHSWKSV